MSLNSIINGHGTPRAGRRTTPVRGEISRSLTAEDLMELATPNENPAQAPMLKQIRSSHHELARLLAKGEKQVRISHITGFSQTRISMLKSDPSFQELLAYYEEMETQTFEKARVDVAERLHSLGVDTLEVLHERVREDPDSLDGKTLIGLAELTLDRIGHGKQSTVDHNVKHSVDEEQLRRIRERPDAPARLTPEDRAGLVGLIMRETEELSGPEEGSGIESEGPGLREEGRKGTSEAARTVIDLPSVDKLSRGSD